ncbi:MAG: anti-sigma factor [Alphaproteobacteria bacterium]
MSPDERDALAAELVLGLLEPDERQRAEALAERDEAFAASVAGWRARFAEIDATARTVPPSPALWSRIETSIGATPRSVPARAAVAIGLAQRLSPLWDSLRFWRISGLAATAAAILLAVGLAAIMGQRAPSPVFVAVLLTENNQPGAVVNAFADGRVELTPLQRIDVPAGRALEVWTLWDRARGPVSIGLMDRARTLRLRVEDLPRTRLDQLFEITLEPATGSPIGRPTGPILMKGTTSRTL